MSNFYLPVYDKDSRNNVRIYNMEYNKETLNEFLEFIKSSYQDKHLFYSEINDKDNLITSKNIDKDNCNLNEYKTNPVIYDMFKTIIQNEFLKLRSLGLYMHLNFNQKTSNNYTDLEKTNILLQLKKFESINSNIHISNKDEICNAIYLIELQNLMKYLTVNEKDMLLKDFENIVIQFFDLFEIDEINYKRHHSKKFEFETPIINKKILDNDVFQKVYKKFF